eukprot:UC4_evm1s1396
MLRKNKRQKCAFNGTTIIAAQKQNDPSPSTFSAEKAVEYSASLEKKLKFNESLNVLTQAAERAGSPNDRIELLLAAGSLSRRLKLFTRAHDFHSQALKERGQVGGLPESYLRAFVEIITDQYSVGNHSEALKMLTVASRSLTSKLNHAPEALALLRKLASHLYECMSDYTKALQAMGEALLIAKPSLEDIGRYRLIALRE